MIATLITALYLSGTLTAPYAANILFIAGALLIIAEIGVASMGFLGLNGALTLLLGYMIKSGEMTFMGVTLDWGLFFGIAFIEFIILLTVVYFTLRQRSLKLTTGTESLIGGQAELIEWHGHSGIARVQGESWKVRLAPGSPEAMPKTGDKVTIKAVDGLTLLIEI
jgi:membrane-bound ClpP family serine protease